jgi:hypothetical protein
VRVTRDVPYGGNTDGEILPDGVGQGYFAMGAALVAVGVGTAGAAVLAMSLLASDLPNPLPEQEIILSATAAETPEPATAEEPVFSDLVPSNGPVAKASATAATLPSQPPAGTDKPEELAALSVGDPRFAHDASAARGIEEVEDISHLIGAESAFGPMKKAGKVPFDRIGAEIEEEKTAAIAPAPAEPDSEDQPAKVQSSGKAVTGTALMTEDANIRSRPQKGAKVIGTVPAQTQVQVVECQSWCEIVVKDKRGFVWGQFVQRDGRASTKFTVTKAAAKPGDDKKPEIVPASKTAPIDSNRSR